MLEYIVNFKEEKTKYFIFQAFVTRFFFFLTVYISNDFTKEGLGKNANTI